MTGSRMTEQPYQKWMGEKNTLTFEEQLEFLQSDLFQPDNFEVKRIWGLILKNQELRPKSFKELANMSYALAILTTPSTDNACKVCIYNPIEVPVQEACDKVAKAFGLPFNYIFMYPKEKIIIAPDHAEYEYPATLYRYQALPTFDTVHQLLALYGGNLLQEQSLRQTGMLNEAEAFFEPQRVFDRLAGIVRRHSLEKLAS